MTTTDDELLTEVGRALAAADAEPDLLDDPRWDRLARGELSAEELAELSALAEGDPDGEAALAAFAPADDLMLGRLEALVHQAPVESEAPATEGPAPAPVAARPAEPAREPEPLATVIPLSRRRLALAVAVPILAAAAALVFFFRPAAAPLPGYALSMEAGDLTVRSGDPGAPDGPDAGQVAELSPDSLVTLLLQPETAASGPIDISLWSGPAGAALERVPLTASRSAGGGASVEATARELVGAEPGLQQLVVVVARPEGAPRDGAEVEAARADGGAARGWRLFTRALNVVAP